MGRRDGELGWRCGGGAERCGEVRRGAERCGEGRRGAERCREGRRGGLAGSGPRTYLATMIPSDSSRISSKLSTPSSLSILLITSGRNGRIPLTLGYRNFMIR